MRPAILATACALAVIAAPSLDAAFEPGARVLLDAHNCYPYNGRWADRIDRALSTGTPLAIEQDLVWFRDPRTGKGRSLVAHDNPGEPALGLTGTEPTMREYFFERVRPIIEGALRDNRRDTWPVITLNLDFKTEEPEHLAAVWALLAEYKPWLTTAVRTAHLSDVQALQIGPMLVLTGEKASGQFLITQARLVATNVQGIVVKNSGHWLMEEAGDQVIPILVQFLQQQE